MELILRTPELAQDRRSLRPLRSGSMPQRNDDPTAQTGAAIPPGPLASCDAPHATEVSADLAEGALAQAEDTPYACVTQQERELHAAYLEAGRRGYAEGFSQGQAAAAEEASLQAARMKATLEGLEAVRGQLIDAAEDDLVSLVFEAVCSLIGSRLVTRDGVAAHVRQTLEHAHADESMVVRLHPADLALVERMAGEQSSVGGDDGCDAVLARLAWKPDDSLSHGGCVVESSAGSLEARLERQLHTLLDALAAARRARRVHPERQP